MPRVVQLDVDDQLFTAFALFGLLNALRYAVIMTKYVIGLLGGSRQSDKIASTTTTDHASEPPAASAVPPITTTTADHASEAPAASAVSPPSQSLSSRPQRSRATDEDDGLPPAPAPTPPAPRQDDGGDIRRRVSGRDVSAGRVQFCVPRIWTTKTGECYHISPSCSGLNGAVERGTASHWRPCPKCNEGPQLWPRRAA